MIPVRDRLIEIFKKYLAGKCSIDDIKKEFPYREITIQINADSTIITCDDIKIEMDSDCRFIAG